MIEQILQESGVPLWRSICGSEETRIGKRPAVRTEVRHGHHGIEIHGVLIVQALAAYFAQTAVDSERMSVRSVRTIKVRP